MRSSIASSPPRLNSIFSPAIGTSARTLEPCTIRRRILLSAFAASPVRGSEPGVGWHVALRLADRYDVTVLCIAGVGEDHFRDEIEAYFLQHEPVPSLHFHFVDPPPLFRRMERHHRNGSLLRALYYAGYAAWQRAALREAMRLHHQSPFDLAHHLNIIGYREPGYLWKMGIPFVWGPLGGAADMPWAYFSLLNWPDALFYTARNLVNHWQKRTRLRCRHAAAAARHIWVVGQDDERMVRDLWHRPCQRLLETGTLPRSQARIRQFDPQRPLRIIWSGLHIGRKALPLLLHAIRQIHPKSTPTLSVLGAGPQTRHWQALANHLGIADQVQWLGNLPHDQAMEAMSQADLCAFTGLQEGTPHAVLEALSLGLPVICHAACGMGQAVTEQCGFPVPMCSPAQSIAAFAAAIQHVQHDPSLLSALSAGALRRAEELSWDNNVRRIAEAYEQILTVPKSS